MENVSSNCLSSYKVDGTNLRTGTEAFLGCYLQHSQVWDTAVTGQLLPDAGVVAGKMECWACSLNTKYTK